MSAVARQRTSRLLLDHRGQPLANVVPFARRYEAASQTARLSSWYAGSSDANNAINDPVTIRNRARDLVRNNPWAAKGLNTLTNSTIGYGIRAQVKAKAKGRQRAIANLWQAWAETTACDAAGMHDIYGLQQLAFRSLAESGECLIRLRPRRPEDRLPLPFQIQLLEADYLADALEPSMPDGHSFLRGIEFDAIGRRVAYHLYRKHPGSGDLHGVTDTARVPASEIIHLFRKDRPGQERGVSWFAPVIVTLRELAIYEDALLKKQQIGNLFTGFLISNNPNDFEDELSDELPDLAPGTMYALRPGSDVKFSNPPTAGDDHQFRTNCLRRVAAGLGVTHESLTGDLSQVNFSSARMGAHDMGRNIDSWQWQLFIPTFCNGVFRWFIDAVTLQANIATGDIAVDWTPPARTIVDPNKEFSALLTAVRAGFMTLPEAIRSLGYDPAAVAEEQGEYLKLLDDMGISVESDYRIDAAGKVPVDAPDTGTAGQDQEDTTND